MSIVRALRSPLVPSFLIGLLLVVTSVGLTMVPSGDEAGTDEMPALRPTGGEIAISVGAVVVLYVVVLAGVVFVRYLRRPTRAGTRAAGG